MAEPSGITGYMSNWKDCCLHSIWCTLVSGEFKWFIRYFSTFKCYKGNHKAYAKATKNDNLFKM